MLGNLKGAVESYVEALEEVGALFPSGGEDAGRVARKVKGALGGTAEAVPLQGYLAHDHASP